MDTEVTKANEISKLNDEFRKGYTFTITRGIQARSDMPEIIEKVRNFNTFTEDNDPFDEHDFGSFDWLGETIYWKIDYYDQMLKNWCDPLSPVCKRVLTILLSDEY